jgi:hypothetical protein
MTENTEVFKEGWGLVLVSGLGTDTADTLFAGKSSK